MSVLGMPDLGLTTLDDMARNAGMIAGLDRNVPVIADADTGFGGPLMVARTVSPVYKGLYPWPPPPFSSLGLHHILPGLPMWPNATNRHPQVEKYISLGVAALHIEDQTTTKRCGHLLGKELVDTATFTSRIRAASAARDASGSDIVVIARTDSLQSLGFDEAIARLRSAVAAGADVAFLEGMTTKEQMASCVEAMAPTPCFLNMVSGGLTPLVSADEAREMGYRIVIWPCFAMTAAMLAYRQAAKELRETGMVKEKRNEKGEVVGGIRDCFEVCGLSKYAAFDKEMGGKAFDSV